MLSHTENRRLVSIRAMKSLLWSLFLLFANQFMFHPHLHRRQKDTRLADGIQIDINSVSTYIWQRLLCMHLILTFLSDVLACWSGYTIVHIYACIHGVHDLYAMAWIWACSLQLKQILVRWLPLLLGEMWPGKLMGIVVLQSDLDEASRNCTSEDYEFDPNRD